MYLCSSVSSTESDVNMLLAKVWTAIDRLSAIWKYDLSNKMKQDFFQAAVMSILLYRCTPMDVDKTYREKARQELHKNAMSYIEQILEATPHDTLAVWLLASHLKLSKKDKTCKTLLEKHSPMDPFIWLCQCWPTCKNLLTTALHGHKM